MQTNKPLNACTQLNQPPLFYTGKVSQSSKQGGATDTSEMQTLIKAFTRSKQRYVSYRAQISERIQATGMTAEQYCAIYCIPDHGISPSDLAKKAKLLGPSLSRMIKELQGFGIIDKVQDDADQRASILYITPHGKNLLSKIWTDEDLNLNRGC
jgi:DNA-binding MarR family transcriptional regulator